MSKSSGGMKSASERVNLWQWLSQHIPSI